jgi:hypothetical protein
VLLLYSLLHDDSNFLGFVLSRTDLESMVCVSHCWRSRSFCWSPRTHGADKMPIAYL